MSQATHRRRLCKTMNGGRRCRATVGSIDWKWNVAWVMFWDQTRAVCVRWKVVEYLSTFRNADRRAATSWPLGRSRRRKKQVMSAALLELKAGWTKVLSESSPQLVDVCKAADLHQRRIFGSCDSNRRYAPELGRVHTTVNGLLGTIAVIHSPEFEH